MCNVYKTRYAMAKRIIRSGSTAVTNNESLSELSFGQKQRFNYLSSIYDDENIVLEIVKKIEPRGRNSWSQLNENLRKINNANAVYSMYYNQISQSVDLNETYTSDDIVYIIGEVRRKLDMPPLVGRLKRLCEDDFFTVFMAHDVVTTTQVGRRPSKADVIGYHPVLSLIQGE